MIVGLTEAQNAQKTHLKGAKKPERKRENEFIS